MRPDPIRTPPPSDVEAERCLVGCLLVDPAAVGLAVAIVERSDFYVASLREVFSAAVSLHDRGDPVDVCTVSAELGEASTVGGKSGRQLFVAELFGEVPSGANVEYYARRVAAVSQKRDRIYDQWRALESAYLDDGPAKPRSAAGLDVRTAGSAAQRIFNEVKARSQRAPEVWPTGMSSFDRHLKGFAPGQVWVVLCETGGGKTTFHQSVALGVAKQGNRAAYIALEMSMEQLEAQVVARLAGISEEIVLTGHSSRWDRSTNKWLFTPASDDALDRVLSGCVAYEQLGDAFRFIRPLKAADPETLGGALDHCVRDLQAKVIVVDYIQALVGLSDQDQRETVSQAVTKCVQIAETEGVCVVLAGQRTRNAQGQGKWARPKKTDGAWSSSLENGASVVLSLVPYYEECHTAVFVQKRRFRVPGVGSDFCMSFDTETGRFGPPDHSFVETWREKLKE